MTINVTINNPIYVPIDDNDFETMKYYEEHGIPVRRFAPHGTYHYYAIVEGETKEKADNLSNAYAAKPMLSADVNDLDKNENLLNTPYATYNLTLGISGEQPHDPRDLITKITECSPGTDGMQIWEDALQLFFCGDTELIEYVQMVVGMAAIGKVYESRM